MVDLWFWGGAGGDWEAEGHLVVGMFIGWFICHSRLIGLGLGRWKDQGGVYLVEGVFGNSGVSGVWFFASLARGGVLDLAAVDRAGAPVRYRLACVGIT